MQPQSREVASSKWNRSWRRRGGSPTRPQLRRAPCLGAERPAAKAGGSGTRPYAIALFAAALLGAGFAALRAQAEEPLRPYAVVGDGIPASLTGVRILCHSGPFPEIRLQGDLAPDLSGAGRRWSEAQLRLRIVDARRLNPDSIMPPYYRIDGLERVAAAWRGKPILTAAQIEDVVAYLLTLRDGP